MAVDHGERRATFGRTVGIHGLRLHDRAVAALRPALRIGNRPRRVVPAAPSYKPKGHVSAVPGLSASVASTGSGVTARVSSNHTQASNCFVSEASA